MAKAEVEPGLKLDSLFLSLVIYLSAMIVTTDKHPYAPRFHFLIYKTGIMILVLPRVAAG